MPVPYREDVFKLTSSYKRHRRAVSHVAVLLPFFIDAFALYSSGATHPHCKREVRPSVHHVVAVVKHFVTTQRVGGGVVEGGTPCFKLGTPRGAASKWRIQIIAKPDADWRVLLLHSTNTIIAIASKGT